jgi:hypothetical protein
MGGEIIRKIRFLPVWEEEKENRWLESMSGRGWHLKSRGYLSYFFERGESREYVYRYDFKLATDIDYDDYLGIFSESGWELVAVFANWHYFRHEKGTGGEEIYTDADSKRKRFKRLFALMAALAAMNIVILSNNIFLLSITEDGLKGAPVFMFILWGLMTVVIALLIYAAVRILISLGKLKKSISE